MASVSNGVHLDVPTLEARIQELEQQLAAVTAPPVLPVSAQEMRLQIALEVSGAGCFDIDFITGTVWLSDQYLAIIGYGPGERQFSLDEWMGMGHPDDAAVVLPLAEACLTGQAPSYRAESRLRHKDGGWVWVSGQGRVVARDRAGQATRLIGTIIERTAQRAAEERLRQFELLVEHAPVGLALCGADGRFIYANPACEASYGYPEGLAGKHYLELMTADEQARLAPSLPENASATTWEGRVIHQRQGGSPFPVQIASVALQASDGSPRGAAAIMRDLTTEGEAARQLQLFQFLVESAPTGFAFADLDGVVTYLNPAFRSLLGYEQLPVGLTLSAIAAPCEQERTPAVVGEVATTGVWQGPYVYQRSDGNTLDVHLTAVLIRDREGQPLAFGGIARDIRDEQRAEQERRVLQEQVIAAQQAALCELSTPLIPLAAGVVAMPLIGSIDSARAQQVIETLLEGVAATSATTAILDITGVPVVDTQVANALIRAAQAVKLLGARVVLTGIRPEVAQTLVGLGADLSSITTRSSLQAGIAFAMGK
jgi:rsbT co-antagonist protein RsbR